MTASSPAVAPASAARSSSGCVRPGRRWWCGTSRAATSIATSAIRIRWESRWSRRWPPTGHRTARRLCGYRRVGVAVGADARGLAEGDRHQPDGDVADDARGRAGDGRRRLGRFDGRGVEHQRDARRSRYGCLLRVEGGHRHAGACRGRRVGRARHPCQRRRARCHPHTDAGRTRTASGWVEGLTERTALGRLGEADDVAEAIVAVLEMSWVTGQTVFADGGLALHSPIDAYGQLKRVMSRRREDRG